MNSLSSDYIKIKALAYENSTHSINNSITDGISFSYDKNFLLISNKFIPKNSKIYIEIEIDTYTYHPEIRHIPIMVGIHKEPSFGVLNSDCCLGAVYYTKNRWYTNLSDIEYLAFRIIEKYAGQDLITRFNNVITTKPPIRQSVIGLAVDMINNVISIYSDGVLFYSFSPQNFHMNDPANVYFALYSSEINKTITGRINFGQFGTKYLPEGYTSLYYDLYLKEKATYDIPSRIYIGERYNHTAFYKDIFEGNVILENELAPVTEHRRDIELVLSDESMTYYKDIKNTIINKHAFTYSPKDNTDLDYAYLNFPIDKFKRLYLEFTCTSANLINDYIGIPIAIGFTRNPDYLTQYSIQADLYHLITDGYHVIKYKDGFRFLEGNYLIENPVYPMQPDTLSLIVDLYTNSVEIYTEGVLFTTINFTDMDFSLSDEPIYLYFISAPNNVYEGSGIVLCNFGTENGDSSYKDDDFVYKALVDNNSVYSMWYYYNYPIREIYMDNTSDILCTIKVIEEKLYYGKHIYCTIMIPEILESQWSPGLNRLWKSYNTISDIQEHNNVPDKSIYDLRKLIIEDKENNRR